MGAGHWEEPQGNFLRGCKCSTPCSIYMWGYRSAYHGGTGLPPHGGTGLPIHGGIGLSKLEELYTLRFVHFTLLTLGNELRVAGRKVGGFFLLFFTHLVI